MTRHFINNKLTDILIVNNKDESYHHLKNVMRIKINHEICFVNEKSSIYKVIEIKDDEVVFKFVRNEEINPELQSNITMCVPFLKKNNFELALQKCSELGCRSFIATNMENCVSVVDLKSFQKKESRYIDILKSACMQSQRNVIPIIEYSNKLQNIDFKKFDLIICCYESRLENLLISFKEDIVSSDNILIICGPEGGISKSEVEFLNELENIRFVNLGSRILRAETALISSCSIISQIVEERSI